MYSPFFIKFQAFMKKIWPTVYSLINGFLYLIFSLIKEFLTTGLKMLFGKQ